MPPKAGRGRGKKKLAGKYRTQKRKAEETEDLEVQEDSSESPTRERRGRKSKKDVSPCTSKTPERSPEGSRSPQRSPQQFQESRQDSPSPLLLVTDSPNPRLTKVNIYNLFLVWMGGGARGVIDFAIYSHTLLFCMYLIFFPFGIFSDKSASPTLPVSFFSILPSTLRRTSS